MKTNREIFEKSQTHYADNIHNPLLTCETYLIQKYCKDKSGYILEAGCGGGRISFAMEQAGYSRIDAFDFNSHFIEVAKTEKSGVNFFIADASSLSELEDNTYDYLVYLQQVISFIPSDLIRSAFEDAYRVCKPGGFFIFSVLNYNGRRINRLLAPILSALRCLRGEKLSSHQLPWLVLKGKPNWSFLSKGQATNYWFTGSEVTQILHEIGFVVDEMFTGNAEISPEKRTGVETATEGTGLYVVCHKE